MNGTSAGIFLCGSWFDPANNLLIFWYFGDDIDTARPTKLAKTRISTWTWPTVNIFFIQDFWKKTEKLQDVSLPVINRVITPISRFFVTPVKLILFRPSIGSGQGPSVARAPSFPPVRQIAVSSGAFGSCRSALRDAGWCRMLVWWWWVWGYGWKKLKKTAGGLTNWSISSSFWYFSFCSWKICFYYKKGSIH